jgi:ArsR family transcriptional regulator, arsenate/arsenite/antimonite-responsive transcriptional repressor
MRVKAPRGSLLLDLVPCLADSLGVATQAPRPAEHLLGIFRALGDETRLRIIERLRGGEQCVCDLTDELGASQSRLSFHLRTLKDAGIVTDRKDGRWVYYTLNAETFELVAQTLDELRPRPQGFRIIRRCD